MKRMLPLILVWLLLSFPLSLPVYAESYDCARGKHKDVVISQRDATQAQEGEIIYKCELCGREYTDHIPATGHNWSGWTIEKDPTCTQEGRKRRRCSLHGGHDEIEAVPATGHKYVLTKKEPSCTEDGVKTFTCSACGDSYTEPGKAAVGHTYTETVTKQPSCTEDGVKTFTCAQDGDTYTEAIQALGHRFDEWRTEEAREGMDGLRFRDCMNCGLREEEIIPALSEEKASPLRQEEETIPARQTDEIRSEEEGAEKEAFFNTMDIIIGVADLAIILFFTALLYPYIFKTRWHNKKFKEFQDKQTKKLREAKKRDFH